MKRAEGQKDRIVEEIRREGEMVLMRFNQALDAATGKKLPEGMWREIIMGLPTQVIDIKTYQEAVEKSAFPRLQRALELIMGTVSFSVRKALQGITRALGKFGYWLEDLPRAPQKGLPRQGSYTA